MSLLSNRGRFSSNEKNNSFKKDTDNKSALSLHGTNPNSLFKIEKSFNDRKVSTLNDKKTKSFDDNFVDNKFITKHYNFEDHTPKKKKKKTALIATMIVVELLTLVGIVALGTFIRVTNMTQKVSFDKAAVQNTNIDEQTLAMMKGYKTVAVFGVDSRTGSVDKGNNSDVNLIVNLNLESGDAQLVSVYRDLYLSVTDSNSYDKLNAAYRKGGPESAVKALNKNLDLNIVNFFSFNWKAVADGIELLGGIDLEISKSEYRYMNAFIHETCIATGIDSKNPAAHYIKSSGMQHLDGVQSVAYGRLRLMDSDFQRVERQKKVISLCLEKAKKLDMSRLRLIMEAVLPQIAYEFDMNEMLSILKIIKKINIVESCGVPEINNVVTMDMGGAGDSVVPLNLEKAVVKLHKILFDKDDYSPSMAVKRYSNRISELRLKYQAENAKKASIKASEEEASRLEELKPKVKKASKSSVSKLKKSSKSNADKKIVTDPNADLDDEDTIPLMDDEIEYEEEPEEDEINSTNVDDENRAPMSVDSPGGNIVPDTSDDKTKNLPISVDSPSSNTTPNPTSPGSSLPTPVMNSDFPGTGNTSPSPTPTPSPSPSPAASSMPSGNGGVVISGPPTG